MSIEGKRILILGGTGQCGMAICRGLIERSPEQVILSGLKEEEVEKGIGDLRPEAEKYGVELRAEHGNVFVREAYKDLTRDEAMEDPEIRKVVLSDILDRLNDDILEGSFLYKLCLRYRPHFIVDCINTATAVAYQDIFFASREVREHIESFASGPMEQARAVIERHLCSQYLPQLIRHVQILYEGMKRVSTEMYIKVGTTGTGGMGLNIPYTHSEERPSRVLLGKSSVAGAHSMLLFLMGRTPDAPVTKEIKPAAVIAWKSIRYGTIKKRGVPLPLYRVDIDDALPLEDGRQYEVSSTYPLMKDGDGNEEVLCSVYVNTGENGLFSRAEFETITSIGQMEFVTPEEIAREVIFEMLGRNSGHDFVSALDQACLGPSYRAGVLREAVLDKMSRLETEHGVDSVAFEMLGPPRLTKLLYEGYLLLRVCKRLESVPERNADELSAAAEGVIADDHRLRSTIVSIGIPILLSDGRRLLRGPVIKVFGTGEGSSWRYDRDRMEEWSRNGWVDLRRENMEKWIERMKTFLRQRGGIPAEDTSSRFERDRTMWGGQEGVDLGQVVSWIFRLEDGGFRIR